MDIQGILQNSTVGMQLGLLRDCHQELRCALRFLLSFSLDPDGSLMLDLPDHLLLSSLFSLLCSVEEKSQFLGLCVLQFQLHRENNYVLLSCQT